MSVEIAVDLGTGLGENKLLKPAGVVPIDIESLF